MEGMIFAAGLGTRLRPLTDDRPKALVKLAGKTLLERVMGKMAFAGIGRIVVNIHHFADMMVREIAEMHIPDVEIRISDERDALLDTGGGLKKAAGFFTAGSPVLIHNVDIWSDLDLRRLQESYERNPVRALMVTREAERGRMLKFDAEGNLAGWLNSRTGETKISRKSFYGSQSRSFCGIQIVSSDFIREMERTGKFSIIDEYLEQAKKYAIKEFPYVGDFADLGTVASLMEVEKEIQGKEEILSERHFIGY